MSIFYYSIKAIRPKVNITMKKKARKYYKSMNTSFSMETRKPKPGKILMKKQNLIKARIRIKE